MRAEKQVRAASVTGLGNIGGSLGGHPSGWVAGRVAPSQSASFRAPGPGNSRDPGGANPHSVADPIPPSAWGEVSAAAQSPPSLALGCPSRRTAGSGRALIPMVNDGWPGWGSVRRCDGHFVGEATGGARPRAPPSGARDCPVAGSGGLHRSGSG